MNSDKINKHRTTNNTRNNTELHNRENSIQVFLRWEVWGFHSCVVERTDIRVCDPLSLCQFFRRFERSTFLEHEIYFYTGCLLMSEFVCCCIGQYVHCVLFCERIYNIQYCVQFMLLSRSRSWNLSVGLSSLHTCHLCFLPSIWSFPWVLTYFNLHTVHFLLCVYK
jgi:hypothetical protein